MPSHVMGSPFFAVADEKGGFKIADVPDGKATLKVWSQGRWVHEEAVEVGPMADMDQEHHIAFPRLDEAEVETLAGMADLCSFEDGAALFRAGPSQCRSTQLYEALSSPPTNHLA